MSEHDTEKCKEVFAMLSQYLDLELPPDACDHVQRHLAGCPPCIEFAESLRKTVDLCHEYAPQEIPAPIGGKAREELLAAWQKMLAGRQ